MKVAIFSGGPYEEVAIDKYDILICADKGYLYARNLSLSPNFILGDFDSLGFVPDGAETYPVDKDYSDLELAIDKAFSLKATEIDAYFCTGGRLDHELFNISLLKKCKINGVKARILTKTQALQILDYTDALSPIKCKENGYVSILPFTDEVVFNGSENLKYSLSGVIAKKGETLTLSNESLGSSVIIEIKSGDALLITER